jgi:hypothetical protein
MGWAKLCEVYQLVCQSLCADAPLHTRFDRTRHEGAQVMTYRVETDGGEKKRAGNEKEGEEEDRDTDSEGYDAYEMGEWENSGLVEDEQAGVLHLVYGWIQQNQPRKVRRDIHLLLYLIE